ncbi:MAG: ABC transporter ATP-binding protein [Ruminococcus sp.]|uniref:ABC transporter ATP-binding protein n=1 Tax=Ruminococcus sp. TaxID=41978 RepID=UPI0025F4E92E|nr:ABC transporter ATP-binding protein [Ruminococcus sp.]MCR4794418.1 ABC transporter ATP-binding protein [Ruminococcus sp.]
MEYVLKTKELTKVYGQKTVADKISLNIRKGDIYGFIGKNGAGKTTTMKMILGMIFPDGGEIELFGKPIDNMGRRRIGSLIEAPGLYKNLTAYENLHRFSLLYGGNEKNISEILEIVNLTDTGKKKAGEFSLGMRQRLGIGIALLGNPDLLVLDEPVNGLDPSAIKRVRDAIININRERGVTVLISSHLLGELAKISTKYGIINSGVLIEEVTAEELDSRCQQSLVIKCRDSGKAGAVLKKSLGIDRFKENDGVLEIFSGLDRAEEINKVLVNAGAGVYDLHITNADMEDYFIERIGR